MKRDKRPPKIEIAQLVVENLTDLLPEEASIKAVTEVLGVPHHIFFIRVALDGGMQVAVNDPYDRLGDVQRLNEGTLCTVEVPGYPGRYVMVLFPFAE